MKNGFTPKEYAYSVAIDALHRAMHNMMDELYGLNETEKKHAIKHMIKLQAKLADTVKLDIGPHRISE